MNTVSQPGPALHAHAIALPRGSLVAAAALVGFSLMAVSTARLLHWRATATPPAAVVTALHLSFTDRPDGGIEVHDADRAGRLIYVVPPETNGFMRGVLRGFARARRNEHVGESPAFTLTRWSDGRLSISDPQTEREVPLEVFGPANSSPFVQLFAADANALGNTPGSAITHPSSLHEERKP